MPRHAACVYCVFPALCWEEAPSTLGSSPLARETFWNSNGSLCGMVEKSHWNISTQPSSTRPPPPSFSLGGGQSMQCHREGAPGLTLLSLQGRGSWMEGGEVGEKGAPQVQCDTCEWYTHTQKKEARSALSAVAICSSALRHWSSACLDPRLIKPKAGEGFKTFGGLFCGWKILLWVRKS